ncbi:MAG: M23 family metallopeptidase [Ferruginibacter sp.]
MKIFSFLLLVSLSLLTSSYKEVKKPSVIAKELYFPVAGTQSNVGSVWGDERDGGRRKHEGIDIFAAKGTAVVAISDGVIKFAGNDDIGGRTVTLQPDDYEWEAYYAHLDVQYVSTGERVKKGQLLGTVGNSGNAQTTPAHLHFGIYTDNGAVDPLPYVKTSPKISSPVPADKRETKQTSRSKKQSSNTRGTINKQIEKEVKTVAVKIVTGELLRRIKIRL